MINTETLDKNRQELERAWKRQQAVFAHAMHPKVPQVGQTPKDVVWTKNKAKLYRYHAVGERKHATPILMIYALINRPYILDLAPGNSMVEFLVNEGYDVFLLDWGKFDEEDQQLRLDDLVVDYIGRAVKQTLKVSGADSLTLFGYCMGGTMALMYAGSHPEAPIKNLVALTTPVDFADAGLFTRWMNADAFDVDRVVDSLGNVPPEFIRHGAKLLKPLQNFMGTYVQLWDKLSDEEFVKTWVLLDHWVNDGIQFPGEAYRQWVKELYQSNKLIKGELRLRDREVKLENITCPVLVAIASLDHIVQKEQATCLMDQVRSADREVYETVTGHVGIVGTSAARSNFYPKLASWLEPRS